MNFSEVLQLHALKRKSWSSNSAILDHAEATGQEIGLRQMCAKVPPQMIEQLSEVCAFLDISKRQFIEGAVSDALDQAAEVIRKSGLEEAFASKEG